MARLRPLYCRHCRQTLYSDDMERCSGCNKVGGMVDPADPNAAGGLASLFDMQNPDAGLTAKREEPGAPMAGLREAVAAYRTLKLGCAAVFFIIIGGTLISTPIFWSSPKGPTLNDAAAGICALLVGVVLILLLVLSFLPRRRHTGATEGPQGPGPDGRPPA